MQPIILTRAVVPPVWSILRPILRTIIYPWFIWHIIGRTLDFVRVKVHLFGPKARIIFHCLHLALFTIVGLPLIVLITGEALIHGNELIVGSSQGSPVRDNGQYWWHSGDTLPLPGPRPPAPAPVSPAAGNEAYHRYLVELHAPVVIQKFGYRPEWDIPVALDFDGDTDPRNNRISADRPQSFRPVVYGEVTAVTNDSVYLLYSFYHVRDYDHPVRQHLTGWSYHDSDNEGYMIRLDKKTMRVVQGEGWYHNRFFLSNRGEESQGNEPVQGKIYLEDGTRPVIYVQHFGHGVRFAQPYDLAAIDRSAKILRFRGKRPAVNPSVDRSVETDANYDIHSFDQWYKFARGPLAPSKKGIFEGSITIGRSIKGEKLTVGRVIAGVDYKKSSWVRPKPPWSWDDGWDNVPVAVWHFFPSRAFEPHFGLPLSHKYSFNRPITKIFGEDANALQKRLVVKGKRRGGAKWGGSIKMKTKYSRQNYIRVGKMLAKRYINRLFRALG